MSSKRAAELKASGVDPPCACDDYVEQVERRERVFNLKLIIALVIALAIVAALVEFIDPR